MGISVGSQSVTAAYLGGNAVDAMYLGTNSVYSDFVAPTVPEQVTGLTAVAGDTTATLSWTAPESALQITAYKISDDINGNAWTIGNSTTTTLTGLINGTTYYLRIAAVDSDGNQGPWSETVSVTPNAVVPGQVTGLSATAGDTTASLSWTAPTSGGAVSDYTVEYTPDGGSASTVQTGSTSTSYNLAGLTNGTSYSVRVAAVDSNGDTGQFSTAVSVTPGNPPSQITQFVVFSHLNNQVMRSWVKPQSDLAITGYRIERTTDNWATQVDDVVPDSGGTTYISTGGGSYTTGVTYSFRIVAISGAGESPASNVVTLTIPDNPEQVTGLTATGGDTVIDLAWTAPASDLAITDYEIAYTPNGGSQQTTLVGSNATTFTLTGLTNGTQYSVLVRAIAYAGTTIQGSVYNRQGAYSAAATATPAAASSGGITPNTDNKARFYLPAATTSFTVGATTTTGYFRITDGTQTSAAAGSSMYANTGGYYFYYDFATATLNSLGGSAKTITLYSTDASGNPSGDLVSVSLVYQSQAVDAVDISGLNLAAFAAYSSSAYGSPPFKYTMMSPGSVLPAGISEIRAVGSTIFLGATSPYVPNYYYGGDLDITGQSLDSNALNTLYTDLLQTTTLRGYPALLVVRGNPGTSGHNPSIATAKGYAVYG